MTQEYQMEIKPSDNDQKTPRRLLKNVIITGDNFLWLLSLNISRSYTTRPNKNNQWRDDPMVVKRGRNGNEKQS